MIRSLRDFVICMALHYIHTMQPYFTSPVPAYLHIEQYIEDPLCDKGFTDWTNKFQRMTLNVYLNQALG